MVTQTNRQFIYVIIVVCAGCLAMFLNTIFYTNHVQRQSEQHWCSLITTLDQAYTSNPPTTPLGRQVALDVHNLVQQFGCDKK